MKDLPASIKARLMNLARAQGIGFNRLQLLYVQERFLARLASGAHRDQFVLKGGLYLYSRYGTLARPTKDVDFLGRATPSDVESVVQTVREIISLELKDGVTFDPEAVTGSVIKEDQEYEGVRVNLIGMLGRSRQPLQIDVGFGDAITAGPVKLEFPTLLNLDGPNAPTILAYSIETVVAEKFEAMVSLGEVNTRYKDFYDIWKIAHTEQLEAKVLREALMNTFTRRGTKLERASSVFAHEYGIGADRQGQWAIFRRKTDLNAPTAFKDLLGEIQGLLEPVVLGRASGRWEPALAVWQPES
jgi:predicted nucleotidyltransferase component of viral defense system